MDSIMTKEAKDEQDRAIIMTRATGNDDQNDLSELPAGTRTRRTLQGDEATQSAMDTLFGVELLPLDDVDSPTPAPTKLLGVDLVPLDDEFFPTQAPTANGSRPTPSPGAWPSYARNNDSRPMDGTVTIIILLIVVFCFIWTPTAVRRCSPQYRRRQRRRRAAEAAAEAALRAILEGRPIVGRTGVLIDTSAVLPHGMSLEDRHDFVSNVLITKELKVSPDEHDEDAVDLSKLAQLQHKKSMVEKGDNDADEESKQVTPTEEDVEQVTSKEEEAEPCAICLSEYEEGDEICLSHNDLCNHIFHRECMVEWLLRHDECPCCRHNYLSLLDTDEDEEQGSMPRTSGGLPVASPVYHHQRPQSERGTNMEYHRHLSESRMAGRMSLFHLLSNSRLGLRTSHTGTMNDDMPNNNISNSIMEARNRNVSFTQESADAIINEAMEMSRMRRMQLRSEMELTPTSISPIRQSSAPILSQSASDRSIAHEETPTPTLSQSASDRSIAYEETPTPTPTTTTSST